MTTTTETMQNEGKCKCYACWDWHASSMMTSDARGRAWCCDCARLLDSAGNVDESKFDSGGCRPSNKRPTRIARGSIVSRRLAKWSKNAGR